MGYFLNLLIHAIVFLLLAAVFDQLDGTVARIQGVTKFGAFLDSITDRIGDFLIFFGIFIGGYISLYLFLAAFISAFLTSYSRSKIESLEDLNLYGIGLIERSDRLPILLIGSMFQIWFQNTLFWTIIILIIGGFITIIQRVYFAYFYLHNKRISEEKRA